jgi:hypothetical protein
MQLKLCILMRFHSIFHRNNYIKIVTVYFNFLRFYTIKLTMIKPIMPVFG